MESVLYQKFDDVRNRDRGQNILCTHDWANGTMLMEMYRFAILFSGFLAVRVETELELRLVWCPSSQAPAKHRDDAGQSEENSREREG